MTTKEIEVVTKKNIYISVDGKQFDNEIDCKTWEKSYECTLEESFKRIPKIKTDGSQLGIPYCTEENDVFVIKPKSLQELTIINAYIDCFVSDFGGNAHLTTDDIGNEIVINLGCKYNQYYDYCDFYNLEGLVEKIKENKDNIVRQLAEVLNKQKEEDKEF